MSSGRRSGRSDRDRYYRNEYEGPADEGSNVYPRNYAPWQWGYWTAENMAYNGREEDYYAMQRDRQRGRPSHFAGNVYDNAGFHGYKHGLGGGSYKMKASSKEGFSEYSGEDIHRRRSRRCCVVAAVVGLVFLLGAALAVGIYFGVVDKPETSKPDVTTTTAAPVPVLSVALTITLNQPFDPDLNDPSTNTYQALKTQVENEIDTNMRNGPQGGSYQSSLVNGFSEGSTFAYFTTFYTRTTYTDGNTVKTIQPENVASVLKDQLASSNSVLFDRNTIQAKISTARGKLSLLDECSSPSDCAVADTICTGVPSVCQCASGYFDNNGVLQKGVCLEKRPIGAKCSNKTNCKTVSSVCSGTPLKCACADGDYFNLETDSCLRKLTHGEAGCVNASVQCQVSGAVCADGKCDCETGYQLKTDTCVELIDIGESGCTEKTDCLTPNAECSDGECNCASGDYYATTKTCETKLTQGEAGCVDASLQCLVSGAVCADGKCDCEAGYQVKANTCVELIDIGESGCTAKTDCLTPNAECFDGECNCASGDYYATTKTCETKIPFEGQCNETSQCITTDAGCLGNKCTCNTEDYHDTNSDACMPKLTQGEAGCVDASIQCLVTGAVCADGKCDCEAGYQLKTDTCVELIDIGESGCTAKTDCLTPNAECSDGECNCASGDYYAATKACEAKIPFEGQCNETSQCITTDAGCLGNKCMCNTEDYHDTNNDECMPKLTQGEAGCLDASLQCLITGAVCADGKCDCETGYQLKTDTCVELIDIGESGCTAKADCLTPNAECSDGDCNCASGDYYATTKTCETKIPFEGQCNETSQCITADSGCLGNKCKCNTEDYHDTNSDACMPMLDQGEEGCTDAELQCKTTDAVCISGACDCDPVSYYNDGKCLPEIPFEGQCNETSQCITTDAGCLGNKCMCNTGDYHDTNSDACMPMLDQGEEGCTDAELQCKTTDAVCISGACDCDHVSYYDDGKCLPEIPFEGQCNETSQCITTDAGCLGNKCMCNTGDYHDTNSDACMPMLDQGEEGCTDAELQCKTTDAVCISGACDCDPVSYYDDGKCLPGQDIGETCVPEKNQCKVSGAICDVTCQCEVGKYSNGTSCNQKVAFNETCTKDEMCQTANGKCLIDICGCRENYYYSKAKDECFIKNAYNTSCTLAEDCITGEVDCIDNLCLCPLGTYLADIACEKTKGNGDICGSKEECGVDGAECDIRCQCPMGTYYDVSCKPKVGLDQPCSNTSHCLSYGAECSDNICACPDKTYRSDASCFPQSLFGFSCGAHEECKTGTCDKNLCGCLATHYYDEKNKICQSKVEYDGNCTATEQCDTKNAECASLKCLCPSNTFLYNNTCLTKLLDGESCTPSDRCSYTNATCLDGFCTCSEGTFANSATLSCDQLKGDGEDCAGPEECGGEGFICDVTCQCPTGTYKSGTTCFQYKSDGVQCEDSEECKPDAECRDGRCQCPVNKYLNNEQCVNRLDYGSECTSSEECMDQFVCKDFTCICEDGYIYDENLLNCTMVVTTTPVPPTMVPDEEITIDTEGTIISNETYDSALADNSSDLYQQKAAEAKAVLENEFGNMTEIENIEIIGFDEGSVIILYRVVWIKSEVYAKIDIIADTVEELNEAINLATKFITNIVKNVIQNVVKGLEDKGVFTGVIVPDVPVDVIKGKCEDEALFIPRAEMDICGSVLLNLQAVRNNPNKRCSAYLDLLKCAAWQYRVAGDDCNWNKWRTNIELLALGALKLDKDALKECHRNNGNAFTFKPVGNQILFANPCKDLTAMKMVAKYSCHTEYSFITLAIDGTDVCSYLTGLEVCVQTVMVQHFSSRYKSCEAEADLDVSLTMFMDNKVEIFDTASASLEKCEFCLAPNIFDVFLTKCGLTLKHMENASMDGACSMLHLEMQCIEAYLQTWSKSCTMDKIINMFRADPRFLNFAKNHLSWLDKESWNACLDTKMKTVGPAEPKSICSNQNYISYVLFFNDCLHIDEDDIGSCIPFYDAADCVRKYIRRKTTDCSYKDIEESILANSTEYDTISTSIAKDGSLNGCIIPNVEDACSSSMTFTLYKDGENIIETCLYSVFNILYLPELEEIETFGYSKETFPCGIYEQAMMCVFFEYTVKIEVCDRMQFRTYIDIGIKELLKSMQLYSNPKPPHGIDVYSGCAAGVNFDVMDCAKDQAVIHSVTAACAPLVMGGETLNDKCSSIGSCTDGAKQWHEKYDLCPGFVEAIERGQHNVDFAYYFWEVSSFNWMACFEEVEYFVILQFPGDPYDSDFSDLSSPTSVLYTASKEKILNFLFVGRPYIIIEIRRITEERSKRQASNSSMGLEMKLGLQGPEEGLNKIIREQYTKLEPAERQSVDIKSVSIADEDDCEQVFRDYWEDCTAEVDFDDFTVTGWTVQQCRALDSIAVCLNEKDISEKCGFSLISEHAFNRIIDELDGDTIDYSYPEECKEESCMQVFREHVEGCTTGIDFDDFKTVITDYKWTGEQCRALESFSACLNDGDEGKGCDYSFFSEQAFIKIIEQLNGDIDEYIYPGEECKVSGCTHVETIYENTEDACFYNIHNIFNTEDMSEQKCRKYKEYKDCIKRELQECESSDLDRFIDENRWNFFMIYQREEKTSAEWLNLEPSMCDNPCWSREAIRNVTVGACSGKLIQLSDRGEMTTDICMDVLDLKKCVQDELHGKIASMGDMYQDMYKCDRMEIKYTLMDILSSDSGESESREMMGEDTTEEVLDFSSLDLEFCEELVCSPRGLTQMADEECHPAWMYYMDEGGCIHVEMFAGCSKFNAVERGQNCSFMNVFKIMNQWGGEIWKEDNDRSMDKHTDEMFSVCPAQCEGEWNVNQGIQVRWSTSSDYSEDAEFTILVPADDDRWGPGKWIGIGLSDDKKMTDSDIVTLEWQSNEKIVLNNRYADGQFEPGLDSGPKNYTYHAWTVDNGDRYIWFKRPRFTDNTEDKVLDGSNHLLFAMGNLDSSSKILQHSATNRWWSETEFDFSCSNEGAEERFDEEFPDPRNQYEKCTYWGLNHYYLRYNCTDNRDNGFLPEEDQCNYKTYTEGCVTEFLQPLYGCTLEQIETAFEDPRTVQGIFDTDINCGSFGSNECDNHIFHSGKAVTDICLPAITRFTQLKMFDVLAEQIKTPEDDKLLKCSLLEDAIGCYMKVKPYNGTNCNASSFGSAINREIMIYQKIAIREANPAAAATFTPVDFGSCTVAADLTIDFDECPPDNVIVEQLAAACLPDFIHDKEANCSRLTMVLTTCYMYFPSMRLEQCNNTRKANALLNYDDYIADLSGGYSLKNCTGINECRAVLSLHFDCAIQYGTLHLLAPFMGFTQKCTMLDKYGRQTEKCLQDRDPICGRHALLFIENDIDQKEENRAAFRYRGECTDMVDMNNTELFRFMDTAGDISICDSKEQLGIMECGWHMSDPYKEDFDCIMRTCFENLEIPEECGTIDRQKLAYDTILGTYGRKLKPCPGLTKSPCDLGYFTKATTDSCDIPWNSYNTPSGDCEDYVHFLICIKYWVVVATEYCTLTDIHHTIETSVKDLGLDAEICEDTDLHALEDSMAESSVEEICSNRVANAHFVKYNCLPMYPDYLTDNNTEPLCLNEMNMQHCVYGITSATAGCMDIAKTRDAFKSEEVQAVLRNLDCDEKFPCQTYMMMDIGPSIKETCLPNTRNILDLDNVDEIKGFGESALSLPCMVYSQSAYCINSFYKEKATTWENQCTIEEFDEGLPKFIPVLIKSLVIDGSLSHMPHPRNDAYFVYLECNEKVFPLPPITDCLDAGQMITAVVASCAPSVKQAGSITAQCIALDICIKHMIDWNEEFNLQCPGYVEQLKKVKMNEKFTAYFKNVTKLDWTKCAEDETYKMTMEMLMEPFKQDFNELSSKASRDLIDRITPWLKKMFTDKGMFYRIQKFFSSLESGREKRQAENSPGVTKMILLVTAGQNPAEEVNATINTDQELKQNLNLISSSVYEEPDDCIAADCVNPDCSTKEGQCCPRCQDPVCAAVSCLKPECDEPETPEGECCPVCPEEPSPCTPEYFQIATEHTCNPSWKRYTKYQNCTDYVHFLSCVWYQDLVRDSECTLEEIHEAMKDKTLSKNLPAEFCEEELTLDFVKSVFPKTIAEICRNWYLNRHLLDYYCLDKESYKNETDMQKKCVKEFGMRDCVHQITSDVRCDMNSTNFVFNDDRLRTGLLQNETDCDKEYPCERVVQLNEEVTDRAVNLLFKKNVGQFKGYNSTKSLVCLTYKFVVQGLYAQMEWNPEFSSCELDQLHQPLMNHIQKKATSDGERKPIHNAEIFSNCTADLSTEVLGDCPAEGSELITMITAGCGNYVNESMKYGPDLGCSALRACLGGIAGWYKERRICISDASDNIDTRLKNAWNNKGFAAYFKNYTGLDWTICPLDKETRTYQVKLWLPNAKYNQQFANISSPAAQEFIRSITPLLNKLFGGRPFTVLRLYTSDSGRAKRQAEMFGVGIDIHVTGTDITQENLEEIAYTFDEENRIEIDFVADIGDLCSQCEWYEMCEDDKCVCNEYCITQYDPVSCNDGTHNRTFSSWCELEKESCQKGEELFKREDCKDPCSECKWYEMCDAGKCECIEYCTEQHDPLFCNNGTHNRTYGNLCKFKTESCQKGELFKLEDCKDSCDNACRGYAQCRSGKCVCDPTPVCTNEFDPVCVSNGTHTRNFTNRCYYDSAYCGNVLDGKQEYTEIECGGQATYEVKLWLPNALYDSQFENISSPAAQEYIGSITPLLNRLFEGRPFRVINLYSSDSDRRKRQVEIKGVGMDVHVDGVGITEKRLSEIAETFDEDDKIEIKSVTDILDRCSECKMYETCEYGKCVCYEYCPTDFDPVFCNNGTHNRTFNNWCTFETASCKEGELFKYEECKDRCSECKWYETCDNGQCKCNEACSTEYEPLFCNNGTHNRTFSNWCTFATASCLEGELFKYEECKDECNDACRGFARCQSGKCVCDATPVCTEEFDPVCISNGTHTRNFTNRCYYDSAYCGNMLDGKQEYTEIECGGQATYEVKLWLPNAIYDPKFANISSLEAQEYIRSVTPLLNKLFEGRPFRVVNLYSSDSDRRKRQVEIKGVGMDVHVDGVGITEKRLSEIAETFDEDDKIEIESVTDILDRCSECKMYETCDNGQCVCNEVCPTENNPVFCNNGTHNRNFSNWCTFEMASCQEGELFKYEECKDRCSECKWYETCDDGQCKCNEACSTEYEPLFCNNGTHNRTFSNWCTFATASCLEGELFKYEECKDECNDACRGFARCQSGKCVCDATPVCTDEFDPVCISNGTHTRNFTNRCYYDSAYCGNMLDGKQEYTEIECGGQATYEVKLWLPNAIYDPKFANISSLEAQEYIRSVTPLLNTLFEGRPFRVVNLFSSDSDRRKRQVEIKGVGIDVHVDGVGITEKRLSEIADTFDEDDKIEIKSVTDILDRCSECKMYETCEYGKCVCYEYCPTDFDPVFCNNGTHNRTFNNWCTFETASCKEGELFKYEECKDRCSECKWYETCDDGQCKCNEACSTEYEPLFCNNGTHNRTFSNWCTFATASCLEGELFKYEECKDECNDACRGFARCQSGKCVCDATPVCTEEFDPVCISNGTHTRNFTNRCYYDSAYCGNMLDGKQEYTEIECGGQATYEVKLWLPNAIYDPKFANISSLEAQEYIRSVTPLLKRLFEGRPFRVVNLYSSDSDRRKRQVEIKGVGMAVHVDGVGITEKRLSEIAETFDEDDKIEIKSVTDILDRCSECKMYETCDNGQCVCNEVCPTENNPVFCNNGTHNRNFSNWCTFEMASCQEGELFKYEECKDRCSECKWYETCDDGQCKCNEACSTEYEPLFCNNGTHNRTFSNWCTFATASCLEGELFKYEECKDECNDACRGFARCQSGKCVCDATPVCTEEFDPVCISNGTHTRNFTNRCYYDSAYCGNMLDGKQEYTEIECGGQATYEVKLWLPNAIYDPKFANISSLEAQEYIRSVTPLLKRLFEGRPFRVVNLYSSDSDRRKRQVEIKGVGMDVHVDGVGITKKNLTEIAETFDEDDKIEIKSVTDIVDRCSECKMYETCEYGKCVCYEYCPTDFDPVFCNNGTHNRNFSNWCTFEMASCQEGELFKYEECKDRCSECKWYETCDDGQCKCNEACSTEYEPLFCNNGTHNRTFSNWCTFATASCLEGELFKYEECKDECNDACRGFARCQSGKCVCDATPVCTEEFDPVCISNGTHTRNFTNRCYYDSAYCGNMLDWKQEYTEIECGGQATYEVKLWLPNAIYDPKFANISSLEAQEYIRSVTPLLKRLFEGRPFRVVNLYSSDSDRRKRQVEIKGVGMDVHVDGVGITKKNLTEIAETFDEDDKIEIKSVTDIVDRCSECKMYETCEYGKCVCYEYCPTDFDPVFCNNGTHNRNFSNWCTFEMASCQEGELFKYEECKDRCSECKWYETCDDGQCKCNEACSTEYEPLFCNNGTHNRTFSNWCTFATASCLEGELFKYEECKDECNDACRGFARCQSGKCVCDATPVCTEEFDPVCISNGTHTRNFTNRCYYDSAYCGNMLDWKQEYTEIECGGQATYEVKLWLPNAIYDPKFANISSLEAQEYIRSVTPLLKRLFEGRPFRVVNLYSSDSDRRKRQVEIKGVGMDVHVDGVGITKKNLTEIAETFDEDDKIEIKSVTDIVDRCSECKMYETCEYGKCVCYEYCPTDFDPVFCNNGTHNRNFSNWCTFEMASCQEGELFKYEECKDRCSECKWYETCDDGQCKCNEACSTEYEPLFCNNGTHNRTFSNWCTFATASCLEGELFKYEECKDECNDACRGFARCQSGKCVCDATPVCTEEFDPVCISNGTHTRNFTNRCYYDSAYCGNMLDGKQEYTEIECGGPGCEKVLEIGWTDEFQNLYSLTEEKEQCRVLVSTTNMVLNTIPEEIDVQTVMDCLLTELGQQQEPDTELATCVFRHYRLFKLHVMPNVDGWNEDYGYKESEIYITLKNNVTSAVNAAVTMTADIEEIYIWVREAMGVEVPEEPGTLETSVDMEIVASLPEAESITWDELKTNLESQEDINLAILDLDSFDGPPGGDDENGGPPVDDDQNGGSQGGDDGAQPPSKK